MKYVEKIRQFKQNEKAKVRTSQLLGTNKKYGTVGEKRLPDHIAMRQKRIKTIICEEKKEMDDENMTTKNAVGRPPK